MVNSNSILIGVLAVLLAQGNGFSTNNIRHTRTASTTRTTRVDMVATGGNFFDEYSSQRRDGSGDEDSMSNNRVRQESAGKSSDKFVTGDDLHRLRHQVLAMRLELQEARGSGNMERVRDLERAIMKTQQVDAEFVYTVSLERQVLAQQAGNPIEAQRFHEKAMDARSALPQFQLEGLWVGKYGEDQGYEMINVTYSGDTLIAHKVTSGTKHVPRGAETFRVDLAPQFAKNHNLISSGPESRQEQTPQNHEVLTPIELGDSAAEQWGCRYLSRFAGQGQVASEGYQDSQWMEGQLILVNEYFSFAWLPIGHQVFFGRPTPELVLKLMNDETKRESSVSSPARSFLEKCWEETQHIEDEMDDDKHQQSGANIYYNQEGCFE